MKYYVFFKYVKPARVKINPMNRILKNLSDQVLEICRSVDVQITLQVLSEVNFLNIVLCVKKRFVPSGFDNRSRLL